MGPNEAIRLLFAARKSRCNLCVQPERFEIEISLDAPPGMVVQTTTSPQVDYRLPFGIKHGLSDLAVL